ncbi:hypothetical protein OEZ85_013492 [Tetradesmus obliquus]|uniref:Peptidase S59 domain-containing protein n=1 Tax=Tetradesmus obliquus TaxID=3088 RepID=A0ABY8UQG1_TETOB|nr:hypothetical protein OEZ85_013492 [Tetradesmus obliquus]
MATLEFGLAPASGGYGTRTAGGSSPFSLSAAASPAAAADAAAAAGGAASNRSGSPAAALLLPVRDNPHRLFIRSPPPSTTPAAGSSFSPAMGGRGQQQQEDGTPARTPPTRRSPYHQQQQSPEAPLSNGTAKQQQQQQHAEDGSPDGGAAAAPSSDKRGGSSAAAAAAGDAPRLGKLAALGYSTEPGDKELQALAAQNPAALSRLSGFRVERPGYGTLEWLAPVDVRGVDLGEIISIERGEVAVYMSSSEGAEPTKPPVGSGLNTACKVTLTGVMKKAKPQQSAAAVAAAFRKRLARYCSEMGARFIDYKPEGGIWIFEVDHFSRYGVPMDEDGSSDEGAEEDDKDDGFGTPPGKSPAGGSQQSQEPELTFGGAPYADADSDDADMAAAGNDVTNDVTQQQQQQQQRKLRFSDAAEAMEGAEDGDMDEEEQGLGFGTLGAGLEQQQQQQTMRQQQQVL